MTDPQQAQLEMVHRLPEARVVNRIDYVTGLARGKRVIHVGFVDAGYEDMQAATGTWLHQHLAAVASSIVGIDVDTSGVERTTARGYEAYVLILKHKLGKAGGETRIAITFDGVVKGDAV